MKNSNLLTSVCMTGIVAALFAMPAMAAPTAVMAPPIGITPPPVIAPTPTPPGLIMCPAGATLTAIEQRMGNQIGELLIMRDPPTPPIVIPPTTPIVPGAPHAMPGVPHSSNITIPDISTLEAFISDALVSDAYAAGTVPTMCTGVSEAKLSADKQTISCTFTKANQPGPGKNPPDTSGAATKDAGPIEEPIDAALAKICTTDALVKAVCDIGCKYYNTAKGFTAANGFK